MSSRPSLGYWVLFIVINIAISALTTWLVVRQLVPSPSAAAGAQALVATATGGPASARSAAPAAAASTPAPNGTSAASNALNPAPNAASTDAVSTDSGQAAATPTLMGTSPPDSASAGTTANTSSATVRISAVIYPGQQSREVIVIVNEGDDVNLNGWTISTPRGKIFTFGNLTLYKDSFINVHTTNGDNTATDLFWNQTEPVWQTGDNVELKQANSVMATYSVK